MKLISESATNKYYITKDGKVFSELKSTGVMKERKCSINAQGYRQIAIQGKIFRIARTILKAYHPLEDYRDFQADHINRVRTDDRFENLRWANPKENGHNRRNVPDSIKHLEGFLNKAKCFRAETKDGELIIEGTSTQVQNFTGCARSTVHSYAKSGKLYRGYIKFIECND